MKLIGRSSGQLLFALVLLMIIELHAEEELRPYKLINADKLIINKIEGEYITNLYAGYQLNQMPPKTTIEKMTNYTLTHLKLNNDGANQGLYLFHQ